MLSYVSPLSNDLIIFHWQMNWTNNSSVIFHKIVVRRSV